MKVYSKRMAGHLESAESPFGGNIVTLWPPLEKKLDVVIGAIKGKGEVQNEKMDQMCAKLDSVDEKLDGLTSDIASCFFEASKRMMNCVHGFGGDIPSCGRNMVKAVVTEKKPGKDLTLGDGEYTMEVARQHRLQKPIESMESLYNEFYGRGKYRGIPVDGGLFGLERMFPPRGRVGGWRTDFGSTYQRHYSRCLFIVKAIHELAGGDEHGVDGANLARTLKESQAMFEHLNREISKMEKYCRQRANISVRGGGGR